MWGILAVCLKVSNNYLSSFDIVWVRFSIAFIIIFVFHLFWRPQAFVIFKKPPLKLVIASLCLAVNYYGYMKGLELTTPSTAQVFIQLGPVLFALAGVYIFKEKITWKHVTGFIIVLAGFGIYYHEQLLTTTTHKLLTTGILLLVIGAIAWSVFAIYQKELTGKWSTSQLNLFIYGICTLIFLPFVHFGNYINLSFGIWLLVISLGLNTLIAYGAIALAFKYLEANKVSVIIILNPIITLLIMYFCNVTGVKWIKPEHFTVLTIIGAAMALGGGVFVILFTRKKQPDH